MSTTTATTTTTLDAATLVERLTREGLISMSAAAAMYGAAREGKPARPSTPTRHALHGVRLPNGQVVKLEIVRIGGRIMTSRAVLRFFAAQNETAPPSETAPVESVRQRSRRAAKASAKLDQILG